MQDISYRETQRMEPVQAVENEYRAQQRVLLLAVESGDIREVRQALHGISPSKQKLVLLARSKIPENNFRTPLMSAAASGNSVIFGENTTTIVMYVLWPTKR